jgi:hypothetical protein
VCTKFVVKPNVNPVSTEQLKVDFQLIYHIPKTTIYRIGKYTENQPLEVLLKFVNPNMSVAKMTLLQFEEDELDPELEKKLTAKITLPAGQLLLESVDASFSDP